MRVNEFVARAVYALRQRVSPRDHVIVLGLHLLVPADHALTVLERLLEVAKVVVAHEVFVVVHEHFLPVDFVEFLSQPTQNVPGARAVGQGQNAVGLVERGLVAVANFEALAVPVNHVEFFLKPLYISVDVRNLNVRTSHYYTRGQANLVDAVGTLLNELVVAVKDIGEALVDVPWGQFGVH